MPHAIRTGRFGSWTSLLPLAFLVISCTPQPKIEIPNPRRLNLAPNTLVFAGDVMFCRAVRRQMLAAQDPALAFRKIAPYFRPADIRFVNLESPFSDRGKYFESGLIFHAAPEAIAGLELAGIDIASTANNHSRDMADRGVAFTYSWLRSHGIEAVGSAENATRAHKGVVLERKGIRFGFLGYTFDQQNGNWRDIDPRIAMTDIPQMRHDVAELKKRCDVVIVSMHNGTEYQPRPNEKQVAFAHAAIDAGAKLVIGHHPHVIQPTERYRNGWICYSLGNFVFDQFQREATQHGEIAEVQFSGTRIVALTAIRVHIGKLGPEIE